MREMEMETLSDILGRNSLGSVANEMRVFYEREGNAKAARAWREVGATLAVQEAERFAAGGTIEPWKDVTVEDRSALGRLGATLEDEDLTQKTQKFYLDGKRHDHAAAAFAGDSKLRELYAKRPIAEKLRDALKRTPEIEIAVRELRDVAREVDRDVGDRECGLVAKALESLGVEMEKMRSQEGREVGRSAQVASGGR